MNLLKHSLKPIFLTAQRKVPFSVGKGPRPTWINSSKFGKEQFLVLYRSKDGNYLKLINIGLLGITAYSLFSYWVRREDDPTASNELILGGITGIVFLLFYVKTRKTPKEILLDKNGKTVYLNLYRLLGLNSKLREVEANKFIGRTTLFHRRIPIPIARFADEGKRDFIFIKTQDFIEEDILRELFIGRSFVVSEENVVVPLSKRYHKDHSK